MDNHPQSLTEREVDALANAFHEPVGARQVLTEAGLPRGRQPAWRDVTAVEFWREVNFLLAAGLLPDGRNRLLLAARRLFPANPVFAGSGESSPSGLAGRRVDDRQASGGVESRSDRRRPEWDFFVSYTTADKAWAEWIAWELEDAGYRVLFQAWDFVPGSHWTTRMREGIANADHMLAILSRAYLGSVYAQEEWEAAYRADPRGFHRKLIPIRVEDCDRPDLLQGVVSFDLFGYTADDARLQLLEMIEMALSGRGKPPAAPIYPGRASPTPSPPAESAEPRPPQKAPPSTAPAFPGHRTPADDEPGTAAAKLPGTAPARPRTAKATVAARRRRLLVVTILLAAIGTATTAVVLTRVDGGASPPDLVAGSRALAEQASDVFPTDAALSFRLAVAAYRLAPTPQARAALLTATGSRFAALATLTRHTGSVHDVAFDPGGTVLATASADGTARLWDVANPHEPQPLATIAGHTNVVVDVAFSPDGTVLATTSFDTTVRLWDVANPREPQPLATLTNHTNAVVAVAFSPDGAVLATASWDDTTQLWNIAELRRPQRFAVLTGHVGDVYNVAFGPPGGKILATAGQDGTTRLWEVTPPGQPRSLATLPEHASGVLDVKISPDGKTLATTSYDRTARLWDITNPARPHPLTVLTGHTGSVHRVDFSPDGAILATGGGEDTAARDNTARLWDIDPGSLARRACEDLHTELSQREWAHYFPSITYRPLCRH